jgi:hypothetical protein
LRQRGHCVRPHVPGASAVRKARMGLKWKPWKLTPLLNLRSMLLRI